MKAYFIRLFNYDHYANKVMMDAITQANYPEKPVQLIAHMLAAQQIWLNRCLNLPPVDIKLWPALGSKVDKLYQQMNNNNQAWISYLNALTPIDFDSVIRYKTIRGEAFENRVSDIITQVINHDTHHRAQIGQLLKLAGIQQLPVTDYIFYIREQKT